MLLNLHEFKICIQEACESADTQMLPNVWSESDYCFDIYIITNEAHTEIS
jgi:hypothetical protein